jgi:hypothetical protein
MLTAGPPARSAGRGAAEISDTVAMCRGSAAAGERDPRDADGVAGEQFSCALDPLLWHERRRCYRCLGLERPPEMPGREASHLSQALQADTGPPNC